MKKRILSTLIAVAVVVAGIPAVFAEEDLNSVDFSNQGITDERLVEMVANGEIPQRVTILDLSRNKITDISPLNSLIDLKELSLQGNNITDIEPLCSLINLNRLRLGYNQITDITPLNILTNLENLYLESNRIVDISPFVALTNLEELYLESNQIVDVSPLFDLTNLEFLNLNYNKINDLEQIEKLRTALPDCKIQYSRDIPPPDWDYWGDFFLVYEGITDEMLAVIVADGTISDDVLFLYLQGNKITDISPLVALTNLEELNLSQNQITDISPLSALTNLKILDLSQNHIKNKQIIAIKIALPNCEIRYSQDYIEYETNPPTSVAFAVTPLILAAGAVLFSRKKRK
ncbi:MAG: leucine-rich repeat domain-containing protein [Oscillospiraceae bacterium]|nr:leucine-rich repeat domain-containing protein [Oscillospiraceae bacterium]